MLTKQEVMRLDEKDVDPKDIETIKASDKGALDTAKRMMMTYALELDLLK